MAVNDKQYLSTRGRFKTLSPPLYFWKIQTVRSFKVHVLKK